MAVVGWVDADAFKARWWDAPDTDDLETFLSVAHGVCLAYAPQPLPDVIPDGWKLAQELQAKHLYARDKSGNRETVGPDGYTVSTFPLVLEARTLIRPKVSPFAGLL